MKIESMRTRVPAVLITGALALTGCSTPAETPAPPPAPSAPASSAPAFRFTVPAKIDGLPRTTRTKWTKVATSATNSLERHVLRPLDTLTAVYVDTGDPAEGVELSAVAGEVADPAVQLRLITQNLNGTFKPTDPGTGTGVGTCSVDRQDRPLIRTTCYWAEPDSVGRVSLWGLTDRRADFPDVRNQI